jgi:hypothetical protein
MRNLYAEIIIILFIYFLFLPSYSLLSLIFEIFDLMFSDWVLFLTYPNLFGIKGFVVVVVVVVEGDEIKVKVIDIDS